MGVGVTEKGAILLGRHFTVDGPAERLVRVVTHAHSDHMVGLGFSVRRSAFVAATPTTHRFLEVLGQGVPPGKRLELPYDKPVEFDGEVLVLKPARHIAGSAQVLVETRDGSYGYTGDFKMPGTPPMKGLDVLVVDATYGSPRLERRWGEWDAISALMEIIEREKRRGPVWIYGYNGKLQEIIVELRRRGLKDDIFTDAQTLALARIAAEFYGEPLGNVRLLSHDAEWGIIMVHYSRFSEYRRRPGAHVLLTGWELSAPARKSGGNVYRVSFSDHASFSEIIEYIDEARPGRVVIDAVRSKTAHLTAKYVERRLGIPAQAMP
ncbi:MBL fold metallo-hydrolase [Stetteria hydrogenophila]